MYLIVGGDSLIGRALASYWSKRDVSYHASTRRSERVAGNRPFIDLNNPESFSLTQKYDGAVLCAAASRLADCEEYPEETYKINVTGICGIAQELERAGTFVLFLSTSQVYDGAVPFRKPEEPVSPVSEYGKQKVEAEKQLLCLGNSVAIVRLTKIFDSSASLLRAWTSSLANDQVIRPFSNMVVAPVLPTFVASILSRIAKAKLSGILHVSASRDVTYEQIAYYLAKRLKKSADLIDPIRYQDVGMPSFSAPLHTTLDAAKICSVLNVSMPDAWTAIESIADEVVADVVSNG